MKIKPEHLDHMRKAIRTVYLERAPFMTRKFYEDYKLGKDHAKRHRWDLLHSAGLTGWICDVLYQYVNDDHIDTALKTLVRELEAEDPKLFLYFESQEGGMETRTIHNLSELQYLYGWMRADCVVEDKALLEWARSADIGEARAHRLGVLVRVKKLI